ncbi:MAG TPA: FAD-dependent oxidoreductase [Polyangia bacterium]|jgi:NADPH-dependent 2,4-dienoyl-CoA reductase/sulfur reductase-like enzyme/nitrite reductase/ring-hydroxylating ferredoxin subunit
MGDAPKVQGPDLAAGVAAGELVDGKPLVGHVGDEGVMLVRRGEEIFATGATCTHYSGPLGEGLVVGETVRCPWHHACFDLRTGEAVKAPALNGIPCWDVVVEGATVRVGQKKQQATGGRRLAAGDVKKVVIVGAGAAGHACAEQLRLRGFTGQVVMIGVDGPVDRPNLSKDYLAGTAPEEWIPLRPSEWFAEHGIELALGARVVAIDGKKRSVTVENGRSYEYDRLLMATGAEPIGLTVEGADDARVRYLRTLDDSRQIVAHAKEGARAVVVGASFIGLEVAASLRARKVEVDVVAPDEVPLGRVMGKELGAFLRGLHEEHGVKFHLGRKPARVDGGGHENSLAVVLDDGTRLPCDFVVVGIGVRPAVALAEKAGLRVDHGIVVDAELRSSDPNIYAAGDLARYPDRKSGKPIRIEHWVVAQRQGQTAARNMLGAHDRFDDVPFFWSQHYDVGINYVGHGHGWDRVELDGSPAARDCAARFFAGDELVALATIFRDAESLDTERQLEQNRA